MARGTGGQKCHGLDAREPAVTEEPGQFERPAKITSAAASILGLIEPQHEHAAFGAALEAIQLPQDGGLDLGVAGARDRQPHLDRDSLDRDGRPARHAGSDQHGDHSYACPAAAGGDDLDRGNRPAVTHRWPRERWADRTSSNSKTA